MKSKGKDERAPDAFLTTDPKLIMRPPRPFSERHRNLLRILAGIAGAALALIMVTRLKRLL